MTKTSADEVIPRKRAEELLQVWKQIVNDHEKLVYESGRLLQEPTEEELDDMKDVLFNRTGEDPKDVFQAFEMYSMQVKVMDRIR